MEITQNHAAMLIELVEEQQHCGRSGAQMDSGRISAAIHAAVQKYAEDFGQEAAERLLAYARRQALLNDAPVVGHGRGR